MLPCGVALAVGAGVASIVEPSWRTIGAPYVLAHGKNVESAAVTAALAAGAATPWLAERRGWVGPLAAIALTGWIVLARYADLALLAHGAWQALAAITLTLPFRLQPAEASDRAIEPCVDVGRGTVLLVLVGLAAVVFTIALEALVIDVFHHGEVLTSALDLLRGGRPFESFIWPHGLHDTGLAAGWLWATGKIGTSPVALSRATCRALAIVTGYTVGRVALGTRRAGLVTALGLAAATVAASTHAHGAAQAQSMHQLGIVVFVGLGFAALARPAAGAAPSRRELVAAGACVALAHLFRIEVGVFALVATVVVLAQRCLMDREAGLAAALAAFVRAGACVAGGIALVLTASALAVGWPGRAWFEYALRELPRYHRDAVGMPFPWPLATGRSARVPAALYPVALGWLLFVLLLLGQTVRAMLGWKDRRRAGHLLFVATFAWLATRSALDRSDEAHVLQWSHVPLLGALLLAIAVARDRFGWSARRTASVVVLALLCFDGAGLRWTSLVTRTLVRLPGRIAASTTLLGEHLRPNPPVGECADLMFTPTESRLPENARFIADTCATERLLAAHGVSRFLIQHSAPWYEARFGQPSTTKFFAFARAYTPAEQRALVDDLRAADAQALLRVRGYQALTVFDVADGLRVPVVDAYLRARRRDVTAISSPIGDWFFWDEPAACVSSSTAGRDAAPLDLLVDRFVYVPMSEMLAAEGWAADRAARRPLASLAISAGAGAPDVDVEYGVARPDVVLTQGVAALERSGWRMTAPIAHEDWQRARATGRLVFAGIASDGRPVSAAVAFADAQELAAVDDPAWGDVRAIMRTASTLGGEDRARACGTRYAGRPCACPAETLPNGAPAAE